MKAEEVCKLLSINKRTLARWRKAKDKDGNPCPRIPFHPYNKRVFYYDDDAVYAMLGAKRKKNNWVAVYARVSSKKDTPLLEEQILRCTEFATKLGLPVDKTFAEIADGYVFGRTARKGFDALMREVFDRNVDVIIIESPDRVNVFGDELFRELCFYFKTRIIFVNSSAYNPRYKNEVIKDVMDQVEIIKKTYSGDDAGGTRSSNAMYDTVTSEKTHRDIIPDSLPGDLLDSI